MEQQNHMVHRDVQNIVIGALGISMVFLATFLIKIPNGIQGYFNLGDGFIFIFASMVSPLTAFLIGGVGSALADAAGGYGMYVIFTLIIKGCEGLFLAYMLKRVSSLPLKICFLGIASLIMVGGYFLADAYINQSWQLSLTGVPANILQAVIGIIIAVSTMPMQKKLTLFQS